MKKYFIWLVLLVVISMAAIYFYIPTTDNILLQRNVSCTESGASRQIINKAKWTMWWPGKKITDNEYSYQSYQYHINKILMNGVEATIFYNAKDSLKAYFQITYNAPDTTQFQWTAKYNFSTNPVKRLQQYFELNKIKNNVEDLLADTKKHFDNPENIYGIKVKQETVKEAFYISTRQTFSTYPTTPEIYKMIQSLREYIANNRDEAKGDPMLHVEQEGASVFVTLVAIPTKSNLPSKGDFRPKRMILGNILTAEVKGGNYTIINSEKELANYVVDYKKLSPAIPFQSLITNRFQQSDTSKWITKLYYPIFQ